MRQFGRAGAMHPATVESLRAALFGSGPFEPVPGTEFGDVDDALFDLGIGHTEPQVVLPYGGRVRVDGPGRRITVWF